MKNKDLVRIYNGINSLTGLKGTKFTYAMAKNKRILEPEVTDIQDTLKKDNPKFVKYQEEMGVITKKLKQEKDEKKVIELQTEFTEVQEKHKETIDKFMAQDKELGEIENKVEVHKIKLEDVPGEITNEQMDSIYELIEGKVDAK